MRKTIAASVIALTFGAGVMTATAQTGVTNAAKQVGEATKDAAKAAGKATKEAVETTGKAAKKGATKAKNAVTGEAHAKCADGTRYSAKTQKAADAACARHGGVAR